jgi:hypothetical protein
MLRNSLKQNLNVKRDYDKLLRFQNEHRGSGAFLCVFGQWDHTKNLILSGGSFATRLKPIYALMKATQYGCHMYELKAPNPNSSEDRGHPYALEAD